MDRELPPSVQSAIAESGAELDRLEKLALAAISLSKEIGEADYMEGIQVGQGAVLRLSDEGVRNLFAAKRLIDDLTNELKEPSHEG